MPTATFLRVCICSTLLSALILDSSAQRSGRRRAATISEQTTQPGLTKEDLVQASEKISALKYLEPVTDVIQDADSTRMTWGKVDCRETNGINKDDVADSYPYITGDGLRLYFTSNREGGHGRFFITTRKSINDPFEEPHVLSRNLTDGYYAGTLTDDELTLCMVNSGEMYISIRANKNAEFPVPVKLQGASDLYHFGPSISADGKEIYVTATVNHKDVTRIYKRTATYTVSLVKDLFLAEGSEAGPGQLSKDGLSYYVSIEKNLVEHLWRYTRKSVLDEFTEPVELPEQIKDLRNRLQPSVNGDESIIVFVTSPTDGWTGDDIVLANSSKKQLEHPALSADVFTNAGNSVKPVVVVNNPEPLDYSNEFHGQQTVDAIESRKAAMFSRKELPSAITRLKVYPNPFVSIVNIELKELPSGGLLFAIFDQSGRLIRQQTINQLRTSVSLARSFAGAYTYQMVDRKGNLVSSGTLMKSNQ